MRNWTENQEKALLEKVTWELTKPWRRREGLE